MAPPGGGVHRSFGVKSRNSARGRDRGRSGRRLYSVPFPSHRPARRALRWSLALLAATAVLPPAPVRAEAGPAVISYPEVKPVPAGESGATSSPCGSHP
jgi:hypothetical protein